MDEAKKLALMTLFLQRGCPVEYLEQACNTLQYQVFTYMPANQIVSFIDHLIAKATE